MAKKRVGDILMGIADFAVPAAAVVASSYGANMAVAGKLGLDAWQTTRDRMRQRKVGKRLAELAPAMQQSELDLLAGQWSQYAPEGADPNYGMGEEFVGAPSPVMVEDNATAKIRLDKFMKAMPKESVELFYQQIGETAEDNPELAQQLLANRQAMLAGMVNSNLEHHASVQKSVIEADLREKADDKARDFTHIENVLNREFTGTENAANRAVDNRRIDVSENQGNRELDLRERGLEQDQAQFEAGLKVRVEEGALDRGSAEKIANLRMSGGTTFKNKAEAVGQIRAVEAAAGGPIYPEDLTPLPGGQPNPRMLELDIAGIDLRTLQAYFEAQNYLAQSGVTRVVKGADGRPVVVNQGQGE